MPRPISADQRDMRIIDGEAISRKSPAAAIARLLGSASLSFSGEQRRSSARSSRACARSRSAAPHPRGAVRGEACGVTARGDRDDVNTLYVLGERGGAHAPVRECAAPASSWRSSASTSSNSQPPIGGRARAIRRFLHRSVTRGGSSLLGLSRQSIFLEKTSWKKEDGRAPSRQLNQIGWKILSAQLAHGANDHDDQLRLPARAGLLED
jgi:hypothetical protein